MVAVPKLMPDEIISRAVYPMIRAMIAKRLVERYHFNQKEVANVLGVTQAAISYYLSDKRAITKQFFENEEIKEMVNKLTDDFVSNKIGKDDLIIGMVRIVNYITNTRALCSIHQFYEKDLRINECNVCSERFSSASDLIKILRRNGK